MCSAFSSNSVYENSTFILLEDVYCPKTKCSGKICLLRKIFPSLGRSDYPCRQCASVCQVRKIPSEDQLNHFFVVWPGGLDFEQNQSKSKQDVIGDVCCLASNVSTK